MIRDLSFTRFNSHSIFSMALRSPTHAFCLRCPAQHSHTDSFTRCAITHHYDLPRYLCAATFLAPLFGAGDFLFTEQSERVNGEEYSAKLIWTESSPLGFTHRHRQS
jgi:hypothetical protein